MHDSYAPAHKLMGQLCEQLGEREKAVSSYKRSLELDDKQRDVLIKVAQLHHQLPDVHVDTMRVGALHETYQFHLNSLGYPLPSVILQCRIVA